MHIFLGSGNIETRHLVLLCAVQIVDDDIQQNEFAQAIRLGENIHPTGIEIAVREVANMHILNIGD